MPKESNLCSQIGDWTIERRSRNNHPGFKVWILQNNYEICSIDERGLRNRSGSSSITIPFTVLTAACEAWQNVVSGDDSIVGPTVPYAYYV